MFITNSLRSTTNILSEVEEAIKLLFNVSPDTVRFESLPSIPSDFSTRTTEDFELLLKEYCIDLLTYIGSTIGVKIELGSINRINNNYNLNVRVNGESLKVEI